MSELKELLATAEEYAARHRAAFETFELGKVEEVWQEENGCICIRYSCGDWYHYRINPEYGNLEWW